MSFTNSGDFTFENADFVLGLYLRSQWTGGIGSIDILAEPGEDAGNAGYLTAINNGNLTLIPTPLGGTPVYGMWFQILGGTGGTGDNNNPSGAGGDAKAGLNLTNNGNFYLDGLMNYGGAALYAVAQGGGGGITEGEGIVGAGGSTSSGSSPDIAVVVLNAGDIFVGSESYPAVSSSLFAGLLASSLGGQPGYYYDNPSNTYADLGSAGGSAGGVQVSQNGEINLRMAAQNTSEAGFYGLYANSVGGSGASSQGGGDDGGPGGDSGAVTITLGEETTVLLDIANETADEQTPNLSGSGVVGLSQGGNGGDTGKHYDGGDAGSGQAVEITLQSGAMVQTSGNWIDGVTAISIGGNGGSGEDDTNGGAGGNSGLVKIHLAAGSSVLTTGNDSNLVVAQSFPGIGGQGDTLGAGGQAGQEVDVIIDHNPVSILYAVDVFNAGTLTAQGENSIGILAQVMPGATFTPANFYGDYPAGLNGQLGLLSVVNEGGISTGTPPGPSVSQDGDLLGPGIASHGILAQSLAGGGGAIGGAIPTLEQLGGDSTTNPYKADGGEVYVRNDGTIATYGHTSHGILAQSVGGGGGDGGSSESLLVAIGSSGGAGGDGGLIHIAGNGGQITTVGDVSHGVVAQSIGGGGGNAGGAKSLSFGDPLDIAIGGSGGSGGHGGNVLVDLQNYTLEVQGISSHSLVLQSIGGGGGTGGSTTSYDLSGGFATSLAVGGKGGSGGDGQQAMAWIASTTVKTGFTTYLSTLPPENEDPSLWFSNLAPVDTHGIILQSIGGGGGKGGSSVAKATAVVVPGSQADDPIDSTITFSVGGKGGHGGNSVGAEVPHGFEIVTIAAVYLEKKDGSSVTTLGQGGHGVVLQSIGGGGGLGGDSSAVSSTRGAGQLDQAPLAVNIGITLGNDGGDGGTAAGVVGYLGGSPAGPEGDAVTVTTYGDYANAWLLQSIGGGGGNAGYGASNTTKHDSASNLVLNLDLGSKGGDGNHAGEVLAVLEAGSSLTTYGGGAAAIMAQSIGGGGGQSLGGSFTVGGGTSVTLLDGQEDGGIDASFNLPELLATVNLGSTGGSAGVAGAVTVDTYGSIQTFGNDSFGIHAQSVGGGGGVGGSAASDASADNPISPVTGKRLGQTTTSDTTAPDADNLSMTYSLGNSGGAGGDGGTTTVNFGGMIETRGDWSMGIVAQSIGGGGGKAATALQSGIEFPNGVTLQMGYPFPNEPNEPEPSLGGNALVTLTGDGGTIATGGTTSSNWEGGFGAIGIVVQSVGGGGGILLEGSNQAQGVINMGMNNNGKGGGVGNGGKAELVVENSASHTITTLGDGAHGVVVQSVGGSGGIALTGSSMSPENPTSDGVDIYLGGGNSTLGKGGEVLVDIQGELSIETSGNGAMGLLAQSVGGGGGLAAAQQVGAVLIGGNVERSYDGSLNTGGAVGVTLSTDTTINTTGTAAHGVLAQSVGGGGGIANYANDAALGISMDAYSNPQFTANGFGMAVGIESAGNISTTGDLAFGILAQSVGAGGGIWQDGGALVFGSTTAPSTSYFEGPPPENVLWGAGMGGEIDIIQSGSVTATGNNSVGIFAQSVGSAAPGQYGKDYWITGKILVEINGEVVGGSGAQGYGVWLDGGGDGLGPDPSGNVNTTTIGAEGSLSAESGNAIQTTGTAINHLINYGTITGSVLGNISIFNNEAEASFFMGSQVDAGQITDYGKSVVAGALQNKIGTSVINGNYTQESTGTLELNIEGNSFGEYATMEINGDGTFTGHMNVWFDDNYLPLLGDIFTLFGVSGTADYDFASIEYNLPQSYEWSTFLGSYEVIVNEFDTITYTTFNILLTAVPEPSATALILLGGLTTLLARRRRGSNEIQQFISHEGR